MKTHLQADGFYRAWKFLDPGTVGCGFRVNWHSSERVRSFTAMAVDYKTMATDYKMRARLRPEAKGKNRDGRRHRMGFSPINIGIGTKPAAIRDHRPRERGESTRHGKRVRHSCGLGNEFLKRTRADDIDFLRLFLLICLICALKCSIVIDMCNEIPFDGLGRHSDAKNPVRSITLVALVNLYLIRNSNYAFQISKKTYYNAWRITCYVSAIINKGIIAEVCVHEYLEFRAS